MWCIVGRVCGLWGHGPLLWQEDVTGWYWPPILLPLGIGWLVLIECLQGRKVSISFLFFVIFVCSNHEEGFTFR